ncbi:LysR family transcriptional regulator [Knoellia subterranea]|uniref:LysR family transcriptional regulator n=1 Tax=Knoellia subterranea KCTC 19937 TaxID=1385521 RepID=A0A0A0JQ33_9MICO|nr:LysR family transcriptional regulator [Knoellia subterranea]KGN39283.1 LysR family transcriptional regulator [Knoellia subterranea KCTC 19937]
MGAPRWPDLGVLELLTAVGSTGSLGAAARQVGMAQPNASRALRGLERDLGLSLVHRSPRGSRLTTHGLLVVEWAAAVLEPALRFGLACDSLRSHARGRLGVAASRTIAEYAVPQWLSTLREESPEVQVMLHVMNSAEVCDAVQEGTSDLGFIEAPRAPRGLRSTVVGRDRLLVVVAPAHPWARRRRPLTAAELAQTPLVLREPGSGTRETLEARLAPLELAPPALELGSNDSIRISVASGAGATVLSELAVRQALAAGTLVEVPVADLDLERRFRAVWSGPAAVRGPASDLVRIARATVTA